MSAREEEDEESDEFLLVDEERLEDIIILTSDSNDDEQDFLTTGGHPGLISTQSIREDGQKEVNDEITAVTVNSISPISNVSTPPVVINLSKSDKNRPITEQLKITHPGTQAGNHGQLDLYFSAVDIACQTEHRKPISEQIFENILQSTRAGSKCLVDGCNNLMNAMKIGTAPGNFTGTLKEDLIQMRTHWGNVFSSMTREMTLERIRYKLFL